ncbi:glycoside hydrolase family 43 protein [Acidimicrobiia bacterium EGI L10123]|uniref:glycoside hydrolase family 43 protein n=1 Tax=Salinilacustrithrix flava TaxID=2957203 RepID=UPI003D7C1672|nr:glycoside hydrolase family 43 protein [Acidimicrobiia bacterium EGI L10123]
MSTRALIGAAAVVVGVAVLSVLAIGAVRASDAAPEPCRGGTTAAGVRCPTDVGPAPAAPDSTGPPGSVPVANAPDAAPLVRLDLPPAPDPDRPATLLALTEPSPSLPNPFVLVEGDRYLMFTTEARDAVGAKQNVPVLESADLQTWHFVRDALPTVGAWAVPEATWAPDVARIDDGWVLFYTARVADLDPPTQCIGAAVGTSPEGPYHPQPEPIVCQLDRGGSIDPRTFRDREGTWWLHWKSDDNRDVEGTSTSTIHAQRLDVTGTALVGEPAAILEVTQPWEGRIVEAPHLIEADGRLWLFYSGNWFNQPAYGIGVAACDTPAGPCTKPFDGPWLSSNAQGEGPGEGSLFLDRDGRWRLVYSPVAQQHRIETDRPVALATVGFDDLGPYLADPAPDR